MPSVIVHPATDLPYASFVLDGLAEVLGPAAIGFSTKGFPAHYGGGRVLAFYRADDPAARCFLSFSDQGNVNPRGLEWARTYGSVNVVDDRVRSEHDILPIGPTFGIRLRSSGLTLRHLAHTWTWARARRARVALARTRGIAQHQRRRTVIGAYVPQRSDPDYVFYVAWPWAKHPEVNPPRIDFIEACRRSPGLEFEGGFAPRRRRDVAEVLSFSTRSRYSIGDYIDRIARSAVAFNNPAVHGCLGWKLGEFLALGKAIISLPITRILPAPLEHGVHIHVVDGSPDSLDRALDLLRNDEVYRQSLEAHAREWYEQHLAPATLAQRLLEQMDS